MRGLQKFTEIFRESGSHRKKCGNGSYFERLIQDDPPPRVTRAVDARDLELAHLQLVSVAELLLDVGKSIAVGMRRSRDARGGRARARLPRRYIGAPKLLVGPGRIPGTTFVVSRRRRLAVSSGKATCGSSREGRASPASTPTSSRTTCLRRGLGDVRVIDYGTPPRTVEKIPRYCAT